MTNGIPFHLPKITNKLLTNNQRVLQHLWRLKRFEKYRFISSKIGTKEHPKHLLKTINKIGMFTVNGQTLDKYILYYLFRIKTIFCLKLPCNTELLNTKNQFKRALLLWIAIKWGIWAILYWQEKSNRVERSVWDPCPDSVTTFALGEWYWLFRSDLPFGYRASFFRC